MSLRIGFIGCVESSKILLEELLTLPSVNVCAVITKKSSKFNADFVDLSSICHKHKLPYHYEFSNNKTQSHEFFEMFDLDVIYCFGWSYLLNKKMISIPRIGAIGFHPAKLPRNRGRHPIIWALALGLKKTASTFFKMDLGADSGPILDQKVIDISETDNAKSLYKKILTVAVSQMKVFTHELERGTAKFVEQDIKKATYWRKRTQVDGLIDWRMSAQDIYNLIRALAPPYPGAEFEVGGVNLKVTDSEVFRDQYPSDVEPGFVLKKTKTSLLVKTSGNGAILLKNLNLNEVNVSEYL